MSLYTCVGVDGGFIFERGDVARGGERGALIGRGGAIGRWRRYAPEFGNLVSTTQQIVEVDAESIDILPPNADVVCAPVFPRGADGRRGRRGD